jgi:3-deoxy-D-manno-octulosonic-acid transferase
VRSTTALEAMILDKPVIIVDFIKNPFPTPYTESGAAIGVYKEEDLAPTIEKVLHNQKVQKELKNNRKQFVYEHAYKIDGQASKRVVDLIKLMIQESRRNKVLQGDTCAGTNG